MIPVTNFNNENKGFLTLAGDVFDVPIRKDIIHRVVRWQLAKRQQVLYTQIKKTCVSNMWPILRPLNDANYIFFLPKKVNDHEA